MMPKVYSIRDAPAAFARRRSSQNASKIERFPALTSTASSVGELSLSSFWSVSKGKRILDVTVSIAALILLLPVLCFLALVVAHSSSGPVLFAQRRIGRSGRLFTILKFRTMEVAQDQRGTSAITVRGDLRITRVGSFLRRYKLDELPQFLNVLAGDMSLVGPRPKLPHHEAMTMPFRPGLTGAATLAFRNEEELLRLVPAEELDRFYERRIKPMKARLDSQYMEQATLASDLVLLAKTTCACVSGKSNQSHFDILM